MKLKAKLGRESRVLDLEGSPSSVNLGALMQAVSSQFGLEEHDFQLSLNKKDFFTGDDQPLTEFGLVSGDLLHVTGPNLPELPASQSKSQPFDTNSSGLSLHSNTSSSHSIGEQNGPVHSDMDVTSDNQASQSGSTHGEEIVTEVNRYLQEPLVIRESSGRQVPILLQQLYSSASCSNCSDALWVALHALMMEAGFTPCECPEPTVMPASWKRQGFYTCNYTYNVTTDTNGTCSVTGLTFGSSIAVHAKPGTETGFKTEAVQLKSSHYVRELSDDVPSVYRALDKLSRQIKDTICMPVINELVTAAGYRERQGLLALPAEVTLRILTYLDARSLCHMAQTCQDMRAASSDRLIWRHLFIRDFGRPVDSSLDRPWYQLYKDKQEQVREEEERRSQHRLFLPDPLFPLDPGTGPFRPFPPTPMNIIGGDHDLHPEFAAGMPHPFAGGRGGNPLRLPGRVPRGLDPFSVNPLQPGRRGNMTGSPFGNPFHGPFM